MAVQLRRIVPLAFALTSLLGVSTAGIAQAGTPSGAHAARSKHHHKRHHHSTIPQHNGGDHDADNNGGPSDGDGNI